jgi:hypothetical protein
MYKYPNLVITNTTPYLSTICINTGKSPYTSFGICKSALFLNFYCPGPGAPISMKWIFYVDSPAFFSQKMNKLFL